MYHQVNTGSRRKGPSSSPYPQFLQIPLSPTPGGASHPFRVPGNPECHKAGLKIREQKCGRNFVCVTFQRESL